MTSSIFELPRLTEARTAWPTRSLRSMLQARAERGRPDLPLLSVARERGVFVRTAEDDNHNVIPEDLSNYKVARRGDLVINKMKAWQGSLGLAPVDGIVSPAYFVFEADFAVPEFGEYLLRSKPYVAKFGAASDGVRVGQWDLNIPRMRNIAVALPPAEEQAAIVKYLAHANARIDIAVAAKRRLVALLREQRSAFAEAEVTGAAVPDSNQAPVTWIGRVPEGWSVVRVKQVLHGIEQGWSPQCDAQPASDGEWGVLKAGCSNYGVFRAAENKRLPVELKPREWLRVQHGDLLVSRASTRDLVGSAAVALDPPDRLIFSDKTFRLRPRKERVDAEFLALAMATRSARDQIEAGAVGASHSMQNIGQGVIANLWISLPPLPQQLALIARVKSRVHELDGAMERTQREIGLLNEFRARMVADVVTGQVDVRRIAASLPELDLPDCRGASAAIQDGDATEIDNVIDRSEDPSCD